VTIFILGGIVVVVALVLLFFLSDIFDFTAQRFVDTQAYLDSEIVSVSHHVSQCLTDVSQKALVLFGKQGGDFTPDYVVSYYGEPRTFLCLAVSDSDACIYRGVTRSVAEKQLEEYITSHILSCIQEYSFDSDFYTVSRGELSVAVTVYDTTVHILGTYPVTFTKDTFVASSSLYPIVVPVPLGGLLDQVQTILSYEIVGEDIHPVAFSRAYFGMYEISIAKPYPHTVYTLNTFGSDYIFTFAVEGYDAL